MDRRRFLQLFAAATTTFAAQPMLLMSDTSAGSVGLTKVVRFSPISSEAKFLWSQAYVCAESNSLMHTMYAAHGPRMSQYDYYIIFIKDFEKRFGYRPQ